MLFYTTIGFLKIINELAEFLIPALHAAASDEDFDYKMTEDGPWLEMEGKIKV
ncbi:MAG: hypothetical protein JRC67_06145 [Deltaproteobacteria bacterium]|jgi:hypothetical protein|nr:hypothetical protein [Deltaproteobacteria bacterium]